MATMYKTPGVYVEEIPKFPPSIAPVETAIPAFIGYTEKAERNGQDITGKPTRIESIAEYESIFGGAPSQDVTITLDSNNQFVKAEANTKLYLYDSLRLFYANGGGNCYILSVGKYPTSISSATLENAIALLEQEDEPTIIIAPDVVSDANGPYAFHKKALEHCNKMMDRVTICDLQVSGDSVAFRTEVQDFRDQLGINYLKYGAAYGPWIYASLPRTLLRRNITILRQGSSSPVPLSGLTTDTAIQGLIADIINVESFITAASTAEDTVTTNPNLSLEDRLKVLLDAYNTAAAPANPTAANLEAALVPISNYAISIVNQVILRHTAAPTPTNNRFKLQGDLEKYRDSSGIKDALSNLAMHHKYLSVPANGDIDLLATGAPLDSVAAFMGFTNGTTLLNPTPSGSVTGAYTGLTTAKEKGNTGLGVILGFANGAIAFFRFMETAQNNYEKTMNESLLASFGAYKQLVQKGAEALNLLPPSGAIAGIYAATDRERGVWKAPANVSLNAVIGPAVKISHEQQAEYNVDVNAGKSINIIRSFTGKGTLVWGARTLAGNDNEWRYVPVRRFFNFVEESVKKATEQFVFEPNDANTWVRVQAMIENFLTTLWRQGALQGVKPEHAFYVAVGLGKTMTPLDILEGRMIIEIGMAAVRPAEFIILRFSHKMAES